MSRIIINGREFAAESVSIINGVVTIDGKRQDGSVRGVVEVRVIEGVLGDLRSDASVNCGSVRGNVNAGGSVNCDNIGGNVSAGGSVNCDDIGGAVVAGGSIRRG